MRCGFVLPHGDARAAAELAQEAEAAGWDGFFTYEAIWGIDAWVLLTAAAMRTERIRLGTMLSPISRMRPWELASKAATLDNLSGGRVIITVGLGALDTGFAEFGEVTDLRTRAELMDEGLEIMTGLWQGQPFTYRGKHYSIAPLERFTPPPPVQQPRIPIWVVGAWPYPRSLDRTLRYDGLLPATVEPGKGTRSVTSDELRQISAYVAERRSGETATPFDIIQEGVTPADDRVRASEIVTEWRDAGATWWIESMWDSDHSREALVHRLRQGPPMVTG